ncbi:hypothetical protein PPTG_14804 [Phytophthora nicotianae INRA-310]|uniref:Ubiquitin-like protease family profile domain-containing protein n=1 Tax=Phytophthora nicotianae (strain INRA-310) TaxID=761204 RepID=W2PYN5_PHYN3|nr:hypothetical protein PPTG_14804 [Phytophthora nicotianae INRA-310]ETN05140.1 hypothetical protein PPTG_14804 [Phytophthora nicotianae INRA-310]
MPPRLRNAQKRPLSADDIDVDNDSNASDGSSSEWQPSPSPPRVEMTGTTSSASEESGQICVIAPPPGETQFRSWEEFEIYLAKYQAQLFQIFRVRTNTSVAVRNGRIDAQGSSASKHSAEWENYAKTYVCTHYGDSGLGMLCPAMAYLKYVARRFKNGEYNISSSYLPPEEQQSELTLPPTQLERDQPHGAGADVVSENAPVDSNSLSVGTGSQSVEPVSQSGESGTQSGESGTQSGESGTQSGESGTQSGFEPQIALATLPQANDVFEVASPPRSRGRPKQAARSKKEARRKNVQTVQDDSNLYAANLSLANVQDAVEGEPTYKESAAILSRFKLFEFSKKPRAPVAHNKLSLPPAKNITPNLAEQDIAVELIGIGTYATETLGVMKKWHRAMKSIQYVEKAISWIETIDFTLPMPQAFRAESDPDMIPKLKAIPLLSVQAEALELVGKSTLGDGTVNTLMLKLFAERVDTIGIDTSIAGNVMNGFLPVDTMKSVLLGATGEKILIPVICGKNHWCSIMIDLTCKDVLIYDPMNSSYGSKVRPLADKLVTMLPDFAPRKYRVRLYLSELGVQVDSYNCGMYMLLAFEVFAGANTLSLLSRKELQYLRYRYLGMCI